MLEWNNRAGQKNKHSNRPSSGEKRGPGEGPQSREQHGSSGWQSDDVPANARDVHKTATPTQRQALLSCPENSGTTGAQGFTESCELQICIADHTTNSSVNLFYFDVKISFSFSNECIVDF